MEAQELLEDCPAMEDSDVEMEGDESTTEEGSTSTLSQAPSAKKTRAEIVQSIAESATPAATRVAVGRPKGTTASAIAEAKSKAKPAQKKTHCWGGCGRLLLLSLPRQLLTLTLMPSPRPPPKHHCNIICSNFDITLPLNGLLHIRKIFLGCPPPQKTAT